MDVLLRSAPATGVLPRSVAKEYSPGTSYGNRGLRDTDGLPRSTRQQIRLASHSCRRWVLWSRPY